MNWHTIFRLNYKNSHFEPIDLNLQQSDFGNRFYKNQALNWHFFLKK